MFAFSVTKTYIKCRNIDIIIPKSLEIYKTIIILVINGDNSCCPLQSTNLDSDAQNRQVTLYANHYIIVTVIT